MHVRVERIDWSAPQCHEDVLYYQVQGDEVTVDGRHVPRRHLLIRARLLWAVNRNRRE